jgi:hypothetical protein
VKAKCFFGAHEIEAFLVQVTVTMQLKLSGRVIVSLRAIQIVLEFLALRLDLHLFDDQSEKVRLLVHRCFDYVNSVMRRAMYFEMFMTETC